MATTTATPEQLEVMNCPFCGWEALEGEYAMLLHMETQHAEGQSPFVVHENADEGQFSETAKASAGVAADENGRSNHQNGGASGWDAENSPGTVNDEPEHVECPVDGCGEVVWMDEMNYHLELHAAETVDEGVLNGNHGDTQTVRPERQPRDHAREKSSEPPVAAPSLPASSSPYASEPRGHHSQSENRSHRPEQPPTKQQKAIFEWRRIFGMATPRSTPSKGRSQGTDSSSSDTPSKRLGKAQLGKYAHEDRMPDWLVQLLLNGGQVRAEGIIPVMAQLLEECQSTKVAYLCHPCVQHVSKLKKEGGFCGYRNIQMMSSYLNGVKVSGAERFNGKLPSIFLIQDLIEAAWDQGINAQAREETGGIKGSRKYIGTPEALALLRLLEIPCDPQGFKDREAGKSEALLMEAVQNYFQSGVMDPSQKVRRTNLPPIYFQHAGHSMTIVGLEKLTNGGKNLLVFDPMFRDSPAVTKLIGKRFQHDHPDIPLKQYRRGSKYLKKYREFEILRLRAPPGGF